MTIDARSIAIQTFNSAQDLLYSTRSSDQDIDLLSLALVSRHYWRMVGGAKEYSTSDWLVSRVFALLGSGNPAVQFADLSLSHSQAGFEHWRKASLHEGVARAYKCVGDTEKFYAHLEIARAELAAEEDSEDAAIIAEQIRDL